MRSVKSVSLQNGLGECQDLLKLFEEGNLLTIRLMLSNSRWIDVELFERGLEPIIEIRTEGIIIICPEAANSIRISTKVL